MMEKVGLLLLSSTEKKKRFGYWQENRLGGIISLMVLLFTYGMGCNGSFIDLYNILHFLCVLYIVETEWPVIWEQSHLTKKSYYITLNQEQSQMTSSSTSVDLICGACPSMFRDRMWLVSQAPPTTSSKEEELDIKLRPFALQWTACFELWQKDQDPVVVPVHYESIVHCVLLLYDIRMQRSQNINIGLMPFKLRKT